MEGKEFDPKEPELGQQLVEKEFGPRERELAPEWVQQLAERVSEEQVSQQELE